MTPTERAQHLVDMAVDEASPGSGAWGALRSILIRRIAEREVEIDRLRSVVGNHYEAHRVGLQNERALAARVKVLETEMAHALELLNRALLLAERPEPEGTR